jgi:FkbM family methyltransferase
MNAPETLKERRARRAQKRGVYVSPPARVVRCEVHGQPVFFTVANPRDEIQRHHLAGGFYEPEELAIIARAFPLGGRFLDVGANVGNHSLYLARFLHAALVLPVEPNPAAAELLLSNLSLNGVAGRCDLRFLGVGLSDHAAEAAAVRAPRRNLGAGRLVEGEGGIRIARGDDLFAGMTFDLVKIDVEGMELQVLAGMEGLIRATRPKLFVEVDQANDAGFHDWLSRLGYRAAETFRRYERNLNYLAEPVT